MGQIYPLHTRDYRINEIFYSLQGEGIHAGVPSIFIRFSGCNLQCAVETHGFDCDTEFKSGRHLNGKDILEEAQRASSTCKRIIFTGGEPLLQLDVELCEVFRDYEIAIETNGSIDPEPELKAHLNWITCSPKVAEHAVRLSGCDELKYVRAYGQALPQPAHLKNCKNKLISPAFNGMSIDRQTLDWCIQLTKDNPEWRLSVQLHKFLGIR